MTVVALIAFGLFNFTGDPVTFMVGQDATQEQRAQLRADLGLDQPFYVQFGRFVGRAVQGEFGLSLRQGRPVSTLLKERLPGYEFRLAVKPADSNFTSILPLPAVPSRLPETLRLVSDQLPVM